ncbi:MAG: excinuclease ABC subunit UvrC [Prevotellaceae bacterium]|jgi:excinuclease ABC subunit C|nr:excinuclease ABC subunit UvrC [Prevotellaceae bacterium]
MQNSVVILKEKAGALPDSPGVYRFLDASGVIIYVGKAKNLRKRVLSYFFERDNSAKCQIMVRKICDIQHIVTITEIDALLLENNLIKEHQPRYNVLLKDDKTFPWVCIKNEQFPRIFLTRKKVRDGSQYFGPFASIGMVKTLLELIRDIYPLRSCKLNLSPSAIARKKYGVCLDYHIGRCRGACMGLQSVDEYGETIEQAAKIIRGKIQDVVGTLSEKMNLAAKNLNFEEAEKIREKLMRLKNYQSKSVIVSPATNDVDVFSLHIDAGAAYANFMRVVAGSVIQAYTLEMRFGIEEEKESILSMFIAEVKQRFDLLSDELVVPFMPDILFDGKTYTVPRRGEKQKLLELSEKNAKAYCLEKLKYLEKTDPEKHTNRILNTIKSDLRLTELPYRIECFDNSNIQGTNPVAACVVFINAKPAKSEYRHFNIKTVTGPDDFASMEEIVYRRYSRLTEENRPLPQLIVIDGGKGQLHAAVNSLEKLNLLDKIPVLGLAKRLEEIYFPNDSVPLHLNKNSETLKVLMHIRDEAHRFGIEFHRNKRSRNFINSELLKIKGVGATSLQKLMTELKTVSAIKSAPEEELAKIVGAKIARLIREYFDRN